MEDNNKQYNNEVLAEKETTDIKKKCKCCGKELPITNFNKKGSGYRTICIECERKNSGISDRFKSFTDRDLMEELRSRGYKGTFKKIEIKEYKL